MSNEGQLSVNLTFTKNGETFQARPRAITPNFDVAGSKPIHMIFTIGSTDTVLDIENVGTPGYIFFFNPDLTSSVALGDDGSSYPNKLRTNGGVGLVEWNGAAIHAIASPGGADIEALILPV